MNIDVDIDDESDESVVESAYDKTTRLLEANPGWVSGAYIARKLGITRAGVRRHDHKLKRKVIEGITLYEQHSVNRLLNGYKRHVGHRLTFKGVELEQIMHICAVYYKTQYDAGPKEILRLAKKVAKL